MDNGHEILHNRAIELYYNNPSVCRNCGKIIEVGNRRPSVARKKKFCNSSCASSYNNRVSPKRLSSAPDHGSCKRCGKRIQFKKRPDCVNSFYSRKYCDNCLGPVQAQTNKIRCLKRNNHDGYSEYLTKGELKTRAGTKELSRAYITKMARARYLNSGRGYKCLMCGYSQHVEVCHIKAVYKFSDGSTIMEINDINNLVALCPNHHWEFDNGMIPIEDINARIVQREDD